MNREELLEKVAVANKLFCSAKKELYIFDSLIENNVFAKLSDARSTMEERLSNEASEDCEGSYNYGQTQYEQLFMVDGRKYLATLDVEYGRHDKRYYYVEDTSFEVKEIEE